MTGPGLEEADGVRLNHRPSQEPELDDEGTGLMSIEQHETWTKQLLLQSLTWLGRGCLLLHSLLFLAIAGSLICVLFVG